MAKKYDLPAMPFYPGDWFKCPEVRALSLQARAAWFEMLLLMWESTERGYLTLAGKPFPKEALARCLGIASDLLDVLLDEMMAFNVFSKREDGAVYNRRMVRDAEISIKRQEAGKIGGFAKAKSYQKSGKSIGKSLASTEYENENEVESENESEPEKEESPFHLDIALCLKTRILETRQQKITEKTINDWAKTVRLMVTRDHRTPADIRTLIDECHDMEPTSSGFTWRNNILSMGKLREKWNEGKIFIGMTKKTAKAPKYGRQEVSNEALKRMMEVELE